MNFYNSDGLTSNANHDGNGNQGLQHAELGPSYEDVDNQKIRKKFYNMMVNK